MGYTVKIQRVERGSTKSFYVNFPAAVAESARINKGEEMEWLIDDRDTFVLRRIKPSASVRRPPKPTRPHREVKIKHPQNNGAPPAFVP